MPERVTWAGWLRTRATPKARMVLSLRGRSPSDAANVADRRLKCGKIDAFTHGYLRGTIDVLAAQYRREKLIV